MSECQLLETEYQTLKNLQEEFEVELANAIKSGKTEKVQTLKKVITEKLQNLKEKLYPKAITASYLNSKTNKTKEIKFNIPEVIEKQKAFYQAHNLENFNEQEVKKIFQCHKAEIQREMETCGYDTITIIPANLPTTETLNQKMTEGLSLNEYLLIQRQYFENTQKHLDGNGWTWLPKSRSAYRVVSSYWNPSSGQLGVRAYDLGYSDVYLGCRLSRSFELT
ncbi:MAG: hypothetical protein WCK16_01420 [Candidatus Moraniibacteriota bacterium]